MNFHLSDSTGLCSRAIMVFLTLAIIGTLLGACVTDNKSCSENWEKVDNLQGAIERLAAAMEKELACDLYFELPEGSFEGVMVMPGGVHLRGQGIGRTILKLPDDSEDGVVLKLEPGEQKTCSVESLQIDANDGVGIYAEGAGTVELSKLRVNVEGSARGGVAFRLKDIPDFTMLQSSAGGNVNKSNVGVINPSSVEMFAATGLLIEDCRKGELQDVSVEGFAHQGARLSGSGNISWKSSDTGSVISDCVRVGIVATDGVRLEMQSIDFRNIWMGGFNNSGVGLLASESEISGKEMTFSNCDLVGALAHNSQITLDDVVLQDSFFGFWAQKDDDSSTLANIHLSGIKAVNLRGVAIGAYGVDDFLISDSTIQDVAKASLPWEGGSKQDMGDGFQILNMTDNISVTNIQIDNCERSGIILDAAPDQEGLHKKIVADFTGTSIAGNGERGFVIQNGELAYDPETQTIDYGDGINPPALEDDLKDKDIIAIETGAPLLDVNSLLPLSDIMD